MADDQSIIVITGANSGVGLELVAQLVGDPTKHVILCSRSTEKGERALKVIKALNGPGSVELLQLDVSDETSIEKAAKTVGAKYGRIDALVNNAALGFQEGSLAQQHARAFAINATGPLLVTNAFEPLLCNSPQIPRIINVSSGGGSILKRLDPTNYANKQGFWGLPYSASKAALNFITVTQASVYGSRSADSEQTDLTKPGARGKPFKVFAYTPGFTISSLGPYNNAEHGASPTSEGAAPMVDILNGNKDNEHACFLSKEGQYPW